MADERGVSVEYRLNLSVSQVIDHKLERVYSPQG